MGRHNCLPANFSPGSGEYRHGEDARPDVKKLSLKADLVEVLS
jgi:hypothetical protein